MAVAYPLLALFCDIGGTMGLILGSSVLTLFEIGDFILVAISNNILRKKTKQTRRTSGNSLSDTETSAGPFK